MELTQLEKAILEAFAAYDLENSEAIKLQMRDLVLLDRENTGAGFFTGFEPAHGTKAVKNRAITGISAKISGLSNPMVFVLFSDEHGHIRMLEGASIDDDTTSIDFSKISFEILKNDQ